MEAGEPKTLVLALPARDEPNAETVALLEKVLERAKAGELQAVALTGVLSDGCLITAFTSHQPAIFTVLGGLQWLTARLMQAADEINGES